MRSGTWLLPLLVGLLSCDVERVDPRVPVPRADTGMSPEPLPPREATRDCPEQLAGTIDVDRTIPAGCVARVVGHLSIDGATLTLEAGARLEFERDKGLVVASYRPGKLRVKGTDAAPVIFTAAGGPGAPWAGLTLGPGAEGSVLEHLELRDGPAGRVWLTSRSDGVVLDAVVDRAAADAGSPPEGPGAAGEAAGPPEPVRAP